MKGPALIESLEGKGIVQIATGQDFSVALSRTGELYCAGADGHGTVSGGEGHAGSGVQAGGVAAERRRDRRDQAPARTTRWRSPKTAGSSRSAAAAMASSATAASSMAPASSKG